MLVAAAVFAGQAAYSRQYRLRQVGRLDARTVRERHREILRRVAHDRQPRAARIARRRRSGAHRGSRQLRRRPLRRTRIRWRSAASPRRSRSRGHVHRAEIVSLERIRAVAELAEDFGIAPRSELYCSVIVHFENDRPIQLEDRYVLPKLAPDYLNSGFQPNHAPRLLGQGRAAAGGRTPAARR